jgi:tetratricopeptide (TPR) repeat protein
MADLAQVLQTPLEIQKRCMKICQKRSLLFGLVALSVSYAASALPGGVTIDLVQGERGTLAANQLPPECLGSTDLQMGCKAVAEGRIDDARRYLDDEQAKNGKTAAGMVLRGGLDFRLGEYQTAISDFGIALALNPRNADALSGRGLAFFKLKDEASALADLNAALLIKPDLQDALIARALIFVDVDEQGKAADDFVRAADLAATVDKGRAAELYKAAGLIYGLNSRPKDAVARFTAAINLTPEAADLYAYRASQERDMGNQQTALVDYDRAVALNPGDVDARRRRARLLEDMGQTQASLDEFNKLLMTASEDMNLYLGRANVLMDLGRFDDAQADYSAAAKIKPLDDRLVHQRMQNEFYLGHYSAAVRDADRWLATQGKKDSERNVAYTLLWRHISMQRQGIDDHEYMVAAMAALSDRTSWPYPLMEYASGLIVEEQLLSAASIREDSRKASEQQCEAVTYIGERYLSQNQPQPAAVHFRRAMEICPYAFIERTLAMRELGQISITAGSAGGSRNATSGVPGSR